MENILKILESKPMFKSYKGASDDEIKKAEEALAVSFSTEYIIYLLRYGFVTYEGHELTGICKAKRLNVVNVTIYERELSQTIPDSWYVIEQLNIDGIVIWQASSGEIYQTSPGTEPIKLCDLLADYIELA